MPGNQKKSKHDRCVEKVKRDNPNVDNPHAICVAAGVKPASWKKSDGEVRELLKINELGQWSLERVDKSDKSDDSGYIGFDKLKQKLAHKKGVTDPAALAAAIGRKKYGKSKFQAAAAKGTSMKKNENDYKSAIEKLQVALKTLKRKSLLGTNADINTHIENVQNKIKELQYKMNNPDNQQQLSKDDKPHPPGSPEDEAHDVVEFNQKIRDELKDLSPEGRREMLRHLRTLKDKDKLRSRKNQKAGDEKDEPGLA